MTTSVIWALGCLLLVGASLIARRLPIGRTLTMAMAWIAIFGGLYVAALYRGEGAALLRRIQADVAGDRGQVVEGVLRIPMDDDGHFWVRANVNGVETRFLIDSGATVTTLSADTARRAGVAPLTGVPLSVQTANGATMAWPARIARLQVGPIERREERSMIIQTGGDLNVLGMTFLSGLSGWRADQSSLTLQP